MENRGGKRKGAGRKPSPDKKERLQIFIRQSKIDLIGGKKNMQKYLFDKSEELN